MIRSGVIGAGPVVRPVAEPASRRAGCPGAAFR